MLAIIFLRNTQRENCTYIWFLFTKLVAREGEDIESLSVFKQLLQAHQGLVVVVCVTTLAGHIHHQ